MGPRRHSPSSRKSGARQARKEERLKHGCHISFPNSQVMALQTCSHCGTSFGQRCACID